MQFLDCIARIDVVTHETEPATIAYAWFRGADDNDAVPSHWLRGFEVYETVEANQVAHRASDEYKAFRRAVADESLLQRPSDLRFWRPTGIGFLTRERPVIFRGDDAPRHVVIDQFTPGDGAKAGVLDLLRQVANVAAEDLDVRSFWVLDRGEAEADNGVYIFACYESKDAQTKFEAKVRQSWAEMRSLSQDKDWLRTSWRASGIGFIGREKGGLHTRNTSS